MADDLRVINGEGEPRDLRALEYDSRLYMVHVDAALQFDTVGDVLPLEFDSLPLALAYSNSNLLETTTVTDGIDTWIQTYSYDGADNLTGITGWVKQ